VAGIPHNRWFDHTAWMLTAPPDIYAGKPMIITVIPADAIILSFEQELLYLQPCHG